MSEEILTVEKPKEKAKVKEPVKTITPEQEFNEVLNVYTDEYVFNEPETTQPEPKKKGRPKGTKKEAENVIPDSPIITGALLILLIDLLLPKLIAALNNKFDKKKKIKATQLMMQAEQRKELEPICDQVAKQLMLKANPLTVLIISLIGIYGINLLSLKGE